jgi:hypothetical protein
VFYGSGSGPTADGSQLWTQDSPGIRGRSSPIDGFGAALAIGDFDGDGFGELAIGAPGEASGCAGTCPNAGAVTVLRGSVAGLTANRSQLWSQRPAEMPGRHEAFDYFGQALAAGDFDGDGQDDLAIGKKGEDWPRRFWERSKGAVTVLYGTSNGLSASRAGRWTQDSPEVPGDAWRGDRFGASLASADFDGDGQDDLAIGAPGERFGHIRFSGLVNVLYGRPTGLDGQAAQEWSRATPGVLGPDPVDWAGGVAFGLVLCP